MTAAQFAAAQANKSRVPNAGAAPLIVGAFVPDFLWIALATAGIEPTQRQIFFDDWSHSLFSVVLCAALYALLFLKHGRIVVAAMWVAVASHFVLDMPIHPKPVALFPHSTVHLSLGLSTVAPMTYWLVQLTVVLLLLTCYAYQARRLQVAPHPIVASCALIVGWHVALVPG